MIKNNVHVRACKNWNTVTFKALVPWLSKSRSSLNKVCNISKIFLIVNNKFIYFPLRSLENAFALSPQFLSTQSANKVHLCRL